MSDRTQVALAIIRACFANYPEYGNQIRSLCDYSSMGVPGSYYDGPRAYLLYKHHVHPSKARSKADKKLYELALKAQEAMKLPSGCQGEEFRKVGDSFIVNILPNLSRPFQNTRTPATTPTWPDTSLNFRRLASDTHEFIIKAWLF